MKPGAAPLLQTRSHPRPSEDQWCRRVCRLCWFWSPAASPQEPSCEWLHPQPKQPAGHVKRVWFILPRPVSNCANKCAANYVFCVSCVFHTSGMLILMFRINPCQTRKPWTATFTCNLLLNPSLGTLGTFSYLQKLANHLPTLLSHVFSFWPFVPLGLPQLLYKPTFSHSKLSCEPSYIAIRISCLLLLCLVVFWLLHRRTSNSTSNNNFFRYTPQVAGSSSTTSSCFASVLFWTALQRILPFHQEAWLKHDVSINEVCFHGPNAEYEPAIEAKHFKHKSSIKQSSNGSLFLN